MAAAQTNEQVFHDGFYQTHYRHTATFDDTQEDAVTKADVSELLYADPDAEGQAVSN